MDKDRVPEGISASDWQGIRAAHEAWKHAIEPVKGGWQARNPAQQWTTTFDGRGFEARPQSAEWTWGLELRSYGAGDEQREVKGTPEVKAEGHRLAYHWDNTVQEWFVNDGRGLEHGFSVQERPPGPSDAPLTFVLATRGPLRAAVSGDARAVDYRDQSGATVLTYAGLRVWDADGRELGARFTPAKDGVILQVDAKDARYPLLIDPIAQQAYLKASNTGAGDSFGDAVAISGNTVVVGAGGEDSSATAINGNQIDNNAVNSGAAYVFVRNGSTWTQQAYLKASNTGAGDSFGKAVAISGETVVVGADGEDAFAGINSDQSLDNSRENSGAAYVFVRNGSTWTQQAYLKASNVGAGDRFGSSVAISGETVVAGAFGEDSNATGVDGDQNNEAAPNSGAAYVFERNGTTWTQQAYLKASNTGGSDTFGNAVAIARDPSFNDRLTVAVGAAGEDSNATGINGNQTDNSAVNAGAVYVFERNPITREFTQEAYVKASNTGEGDSFGGAVALDRFGSAASLVVGASGESSNANGVNGNQGDNSAVNAGAAYLFLRTASTWAQQAYLKASNTGAGDRFGASVAVDEVSVLVGAPFEASAAVGIDGNQGDNSAANSGAAYFFARSGPAWVQRAYLKASNAGSGDQFGTSVVMSGETVVVGAGGEKSSAASVNGNQNDDSTVNAGAAYVFTGLGPAPVITSPTTANGQVDVLFNYQITTTGGTPDSFSAAGLPVGLSLNQATGAISGKPRGSGTFVIALSASNAGGTGTATLTLTVTDPPPPVVTITSPTTANGRIGVPFAYQISTSGGLADIFFASGLPPGLSIDDTSGLIEGIPAQEGEFLVTLSATGAGGTGTATLTLNVAADVSLKFLPPRRTVTAGRTARFTLLVANNLTRAQNVRAVFFFVGDNSGLIDPAPINVPVPGKKKANQGPKLSRVPVEIPVPAAAAAGTVGVRARVLGEPVGDRTASSQLTIKVPR